MFSIEWGSAPGARQPAIRSEMPVACLSPENQRYTNPRLYVCMYILYLMNDKKEKENKQRQKEVSNEANFYNLLSLIPVFNSSLPVWRTAVNLKLDFFSTYRSTPRKTVSIVPSDDVDREFLRSKQAGVMINKAQSNDGESSPVADPFPNSYPANRIEWINVGRNDDGANCRKHFGSPWFDASEPRFRSGYSACASWSSG